jgi:hypothetical protein
MPFSPDLCGCEHTTRSTHVTESSLTSTVSSSTRDTRNTGNSATYKFNVSNCQLPDMCAKSKSDNPLSAIEFNGPMHIVPEKQKPLLTSTPRLSRSLMASLLAHCIRLTLVLRHSRMNLSAKQSVNCSPTEIINSVKRTGRHRDGLARGRLEEEGEWNR